MLTRIEPETIRKTSRQRLEESNIAKLFVRQLIAESALVLKRKVNFRKRKNPEAVLAYCEMGLPEFNGINARQKWANWRTIPKNLNSRIPLRPLVAIDLCCGTGDSTEVLACYLPKGSKILGLEYNSKFVEAARARSYLDQQGALVHVTFRVQSVLDPFLDENGQPVANASVDLINSCGAVGSHFDRAATRTLVQEINRVLKPGAIATIDSGAPGTSKRELTRIFRAQGFAVENTAKSCALDIFTQICFRKR